MYKSRYFSSSEYKCPCGCGLNSMSENALYNFDRIREAYGKPMVVTSGCRCIEHNKKVSKTDNSAHILQGGDCYAMDIACDNSIDRFRLITIALKTGCTRAGLAKTFIHIDFSPFLPQNCFWLY